MSLRHNVTRFGTAALVLGLTSPALADATIPLARVARDLGFAYAYLPYENAVSLARPGATIVVRPGDAFFFANERREPVYGIVPVYRNNDVYVSRAFVDEIRGLGSRAARVGADIGADAAAPGSVAPTEPPGSVSGATATYDERTDRAVVRGTATPDSIVGVVLKGELASNLPVVVLDRTYVVAAGDGSFEARLSFGADHFAPSQFVVEAYGSRNARPVVARVPGRTSSVRTAADDRK